MAKRKRRKGRQEDQTPRRGTVAKEAHDEAAPQRVGRMRADPVARETTSTADQAAWLGGTRLQRAQRHNLAAQIERTQGNRHVQRVVDVVQAQPARGKRAVRSQLREILTLHRQKYGSLNLTKSLLSVLQLATSRAAQDIAGHWLPAPKSVGEALRRIAPILPDSVSKATMQQLDKARVNLVVSSVAVKASSTPAPTPAVKEAQPGQEKEALAKAIAKMMQGKSADDKSGNTEAMTKLVQAYLATKQGKQVKEKALGLLLSKKGLPFTIMTGSALLAAMVANNTTIPSVPEIPIGDNLSLKVEFEGTMQKPTGIKVMLKFSFGGPKVETVGGKAQTVLALPSELEAYIDRIDRQMLAKWFAKRAFYEWESATPEQEEEKLVFYKAARDRPDALGLPDTRLVARHIARKMVGAAIQNRLKQLQGKSASKRLTIDLGHAQQWNRFMTLEGLTPRMQWLLNLLVPKVPYGAAGIEQVTFRCGKRLIPVTIKRQGKQQ
jgi:hypothetical protein